MEHSNLATGEITKVYCNSSAAKFEWRIPNCSDILKESVISSPTVQCLNVIWHLKLTSNYVFLIRKPSTSGFQGSVRCSIGRREVNREVDIGCNSVFQLNAEYLAWRHWIFRPGTSSAKELIIICRLCRDYSTYEKEFFCVPERDGASCTRGRKDEDPLKVVSCATQTEDASCSNSRINEDPSTDISILLEHFKDLRLSGDDHDFLIKVKDKEFRAHKCVLRARSPVFAAMFRSQMTESADDSVTIDDCDPEAFGEFLSYVYTGKVAISSATHALGLYYAGDKYDFPRLKEMGVDFLKNSLTATTISDVINMALRHDEGELLQQAVAYLATHLEEVLLTVEWQRFLTANPIQANEMCIKALQYVKRD